MTANVHVVLNRNAHRLRDGGRLREEIAQAARARGAALHETRSLDELDQAAYAIADSGVTHVVLAGGDGSYTAGVTAIARAFGDRALPAFAFAPGGTVSTVARNWGLRGEPVQYTRTLIDGVGGSEEIERATLHVTDDRGGDRLGFIFGAGLVANFFDEYYASPHAGYAGAARIVARIFAGSFVGGALAKRVLRPTTCKVTLDGVLARPRAFSLIAASVIRDLGLHMLVTYRAGERLDRVHVVASPLPPHLLGPQMPLVLAGKRLRGAHHVDDLARELKVTFDEGDRRYILDGEPIAAREVTVAAGPPIRVVKI